MSNEPDTLTIAKTHYNYARAGLIVLGIALLIALFIIWLGPSTVIIKPPENNPVIEDGKDPRFSDATKQFLRKEDYDKVLFINTRGQVKLVDDQGIDIKACVFNNGKEFIPIPERKCNDLGKINVTNLINVGILFHNPGGNCPIINGYGYC